LLAWHFVKAILGLSLLTGGSPVGAEPICPFSATMSRDGRYVVGVYEYSQVFIWDLARLGDRLQPVQVHMFEVDHGLSAGKNLVISPNGARLAYEDTKRKRIVACEMAPGFACTPVLALDDSVSLRALRWSPNADNLVVVTGRPPALRVLTFESGGQVTGRRHVEWRREVPVVDWQRGRIAAGSSPSIDMFDLSTLEHQEVVPALVRATPLAFSEDGEHLVASEQGELRLYYVGRRRVDGLVQIRRRIIDRDLLEGPRGTLWYVRKFDGGNSRLWILQRAAQSGLPSNDTHVVETRGPRGTLLGLSEGERYAVLAVGDSCSDEIGLIELATGLPEYRLFPARGDYRPMDFGLPHLPVRAGAEPGYLTDSELTASIQNLLGHAALSVRLRDRHDLLWFALMAKLGTVPALNGAEKLFTDIADATMQLRTAEMLLQTGRADATLSLTGAALANLKAMRARTENSVKPDPPAVQAWEIAASYLPVLAAELQLARVRAAIASGQTEVAREAVERMLKEDPGDWRAHAARLSLSLDAPDALFDRILAQAQEALRLAGWTEALVTGYPTHFFDEDALRALRAAKAEPPD
jgi:hypothetical protein